MASRRNLTVAVVDDDVDTGAALSDVLRVAGFSATAFRGPHEFLTAIARAPFAAVILDLSMPDLGGVDVLRILREELRSTVPVIVCTGLAGPPGLSELRKLGVDAVIRKPADVAAFVRSVERVTAGDALA